MGIGGIRPAPGALDRFEQTRKLQMMGSRRQFVASLLGLLLLVSGSFAQEQYASSHAPLPKYEFRGAWIATVLRLDWPWSIDDTAAQQQQLTDLLDELAASGINAVFFQVRSESDAMYLSDIEPWSYWLTGQQGKAPDPLYDPLEFAIQEAHRRGIELHAWLNPYRVERNVGNYPLDTMHVAVKHPEWLITIGNIAVLNPGLPEVRDYIKGIVADIVSRYDVDGIHFDDYFYPYPPNHISNEDVVTFQNNNPLSINSIDNWRRWNINEMVRAVSEAIAGTNPDVKFGISPFGIWKNGEPSGIVGLDAYNVIYADAVIWMFLQWLDYLMPQLYWKIGGPQDYETLAPWWATKRNERHLYPGHGLYRTDSRTFSSTLFGSSEIPNQVRYNRQHPDIDGSTFFRARNITTYSSKGFSDSLKIDLYRHPALVPFMDWRDDRLPNAPENLSFEWTDTGEATISWDPPLPAEGVPEQRRFAVYRIRSAGVPDFGAALMNPSNLLKVTGETSIKDYPAAATHPYYYVVTSVSRNSVESFESDYIVLEGRAVGVEDVPVVESFSVEQNYPNPFSESTSFTIDLAITGNMYVRVYNAIGQLVAVLVDGEQVAQGEYLVTWNGTSSSGTRVASGTYFYAVDVEGHRVTRPMVVSR